MNSTKIIFYDLVDLYEIFDELKDFLKFKLEIVKNVDDLKIVISKSSDHLIISNHLISNFKNQITIENRPIKIQKLIEKINIEILKNNYSQKSKILVGNYTLNLNSREIFLNNKALKLTEQEIKMIVYLGKSKKPVTISKLQTEIWSYASSLETHTVETHIHRLRKKIFDLFDDKDFILSTKNGYLIN